MAHIHTKPGQHDVTVSAWIFRRDGDVLKAFVHMHRKVKKYSEVGGHMELDETPWQTIVHELEEEAGFTLNELDIYQPVSAPTSLPTVTVHPVPSLLMTYHPVKDHYHSDMSYVFYAKAEPSKKPAEGESDDVRWFTIDELKQGAKDGTVLEDIIATYEVLAHMIEAEGVHLVSAKEFSLGKPAASVAMQEKTVESRILDICRFGNPILRQKARLLKKEAILETATQRFIINMKAELLSTPLGVGLAAPQVGESIALSVIGIKPTPTRPNVQPFDAVIINPSYEGIGEKSDMWEGCLSSGAGEDTLYGKVPRFERIRATWLDENAKQHDEILEGFAAQVFQHETDHLHGVLFVDLVEDPTTYMLENEYRKRVANKS